MCAYCHMSKKSRVGQHYFFFFLLTIGKTGNSRSRFLYPISFSKFPVSRHLFWSCFMRVTQFFYLLCSQFRQKVSGWINKTLLLIKQQKWLSEFCVKIDRVASKNSGRSGDRKHTYFFFGLSREATNTNFIVFGLTRTGLEPTIYRTQGEQANHNTIDVVKNTFGLATYHKCL